MAMDPLVLLRRAIDEPEPDGSVYTTSELSIRLTDAAGSINVVARDIWREKMAAAASLVDTSEGGSSRSMSKVYDRAKAQYDFYAGLANDEVSGGTSILRRIQRV